MPPARSDVPVRTSQEPRHDPAPASRRVAPAGLLLTTVGGRLSSAFRPGRGQRPGTDRTASYPFMGAGTTPDGPGGPGGAGRGSGRSGDPVADGLLARAVARRAAAASTAPAGARSAPAGRFARVRCVILDDYQGVATSYADWGSLPLEVVTVREHLDEDATAAALAGADVVVLMRERTPLSRGLLDRLPDLRLVVTTGMRNASIDLDACRERGIPVCGTASSKTSTAELTWALVLGLLRGVVPEARGLAAGGWQTTVGADLAGRTLALLGLGAIGSRVARVGAAFDMDVIAWSPHLTEERAVAGGARLVGKDELFATADVLSIHLVLAEATRGIVGERELGLLRPSSYLVNTSRAGLVDTAALGRALDEGRLAGAALDVFDIEPLPSGDPWRDRPGVLATPHLGYVTQDNYRRFFTEAVEDVAAWLAGAPVRLLA